MALRAGLHILIASLCLGPATTAARAETGPEPRLLTVEIFDTDGESVRAHHLGQSDLDNLPKAAFATETIWTTGVQRFAGVWLATLLRDLGITTGEIELVGINEYRAFADVGDFREGDALVAYERNGGPLSLRDKGPLWVVFDYDSDTRFRSEPIYALSVWQLDRVEIWR